MQKICKKYACFFNIPQDLSQAKILRNIYLDIKLYQYISGLDILKVEVKHFFGWSILIENWNHTFLNIEFSILSHTFSWAITKVYTLLPILTFSAKASIFVQ